MPQTKTRKLGEKIAARPDVRIICSTHHIDRDTFSYRVKFKIEGGVYRTMDIPCSMFRNATKAAEFLLDKGAILPVDPKDQKNLIYKAVRSKKNGTRKVTSRTGWTDGESPNRAFVYFGKTFRANGASAPVLDKQATRSDPHLGLTAGTLAAWREGLRASCAVSDYLVFSISVAASGPLLSFLDAGEGMSFYIHGAASPPNPEVNSEAKKQSTSGKTTIARGGYSTIGRAKNADLPKFDSTQTRIDELCFLHNNLVAVIDEDSLGVEAGPVMLSKIAYKVSSGSSRGRTNALVTQYPNLKWLLPVITTGEKPIPPGSRKEGAEVRMMPVPVPPGGEGGIFNGLANDADRSKKARVLIKQVERTISENYGKLMPAYLRKVVQDQEKLATEVPALVAEFIAKAGVTHGAWEARAASRFAIVFAAAELLARYGLAPWSAKKPMPAMLRLYKKSRAAMTSHAVTADQAIAYVRDLVSNKKLVDLRKNSSVSFEKAAGAHGFIKAFKGHGAVVMMQAKKLESALGMVPAVMDAAVGELAKRKIILTDTAKKKRVQVKITTTGKVFPRQRYVCFRLKDVE